MEINNDIRKTIMELDDILFISVELLQMKQFGDYFVTEEDSKYMSNVLINLTQKSSRFLRHAAEWDAIEIIITKSNDKSGMSDESLDDYHNISNEMVEDQEWGKSMEIEY